MKIYMKTFFVILLTSAIAMALVRGITYAMGGRADQLLGRVNEARVQLPAVLEKEEPIVMVYGSSMVHAGFSPREFDQWVSEYGAQVDSYNFGFGGLNPFFQDLLAKRIHHAFESQDRRLKLAIIEFNPFQTTKTRWNGAQAVLDSYFTLLASPGEILDVVWDDPRRGLRLLNIRYLRGGISAEMITSFFMGEFGGKRRRSQLPEDEEMEARFDEALENLDGFFEKDYPDYDGCDWCLDWQGGGTIESERSTEVLPWFEQYYANIQRPDYMETDLFNRIDRADILQMRFEEELVRSFIRIVKEFQQFSDDVEVIMLPRNTEWVQYTEAGKKRLTDVLQRIEAETGEPVRNYQVVEGVTNAMFSDTTHLNRYQGAANFTKFLARTYGPGLTAGSK
jgi:hypothetical protein